MADRSACKQLARGSKRAEHFHLAEWNTTPCLLMSTELLALDGITVNAVQGPGEGLLPAKPAPGQGSADAALLDGPAGQGTGRGLPKSGVRATRHLPDQHHGPAVKSRLLRRRRHRNGSARAASTMHCPPAPMKHRAHPSPAVGACEHICKSLGLSTLYDVPPSHGSAVSVEPTSGTDPGQSFIGRMSGRTVSAYPSADGPASPRRSPNGRSRQSNRQVRTVGQLDAAGGEEPDEGCRDPRTACLEYGFTGNPNSPPSTSGPSLTSRPQVSNPSQQAQGSRHIRPTACAPQLPSQRR
ncbi:Hypothetical Protein sle_61520 [Streptomyces leeuwenhoekii]|uniref:Uncharacterized protein n=1 Tax=Streptomyces leeuwenhoekii TaxID=1437453 RepID=A0A0F7W6V0_STRLW|nr:Hypothetical Protein sle_61520 [Streptomyces leeuwenhoekii]